MKKKILEIILIGFIVVGLTGCANKSSSQTDNKKKEDNSVLKIDNVEVKLDGTSSFNKLSYKYSKDASSSNIGTYAIIDLMNGSDLLVRTALSYFPNKTIGEVLQGTTLNSVDALTFNNVTWNVYEGTQSDGKKTINYVTVYDGDAYSIAFISDKNINDYINTFMENALFN